ncbi:MAG: hypothetical protein ACTSYS_13905 [Promethearchaeota archaeon]
MPNPKDKKTISFLVPLDYPFKGAEVKREIDEFFQYVVDNAKTDNKLKAIIRRYPKIRKISKILGGW